MEPVSNVLILLLIAAAQIWLVGGVVAGLASVLRVGSIFGGLRSRIEARALAEPAAQRFGRWTLLHELLGCRLCLSLQLALWLSLALDLGFVLATGEGRWLTLILTVPAAGDLSYRRGD